MKKYFFMIIGLPLLGSALINHNDDLSVEPILTQNLETTVFQYLEQHKKEYQLDNVKENIKIDRVESDKFGLTHTYFQRYYQGVPIYGANIRTHQAQSAKILSVSEKNFEIQKEIITTPTIKSSQAVSISKKHFSKLKINPQIKTVKVQASIPELYIYDRSLFSRYVDSNPKLVWRLNIGLKNTSQQYIYYIDAHTGYVVHYLNSTAHARDRETYVLSTTPDCNTATLAYNEAGIVGSYDADAGWVHLYAGYTYDYFYNQFGRDSFDDEDPSDATDGGGTIKSYTHFRNPDSCSDEFDAGWSSQITEPYEFMYFAEGVYSQDIVGHEFTHGVVDHSANLEYENESAALDESYADIFGTLIEHYTGDTDWTIGEDLPSTRSECITALRSLADPTAYTGYCDGSDDADPDHINDLGGDYSDQYAASVIPSYAFYLLVEGGTHPTSSVTVTAIGESAAAEIYYQTLTHYLSIASDFDDAYAQTLEACIDLNAVDSTTYPISYCESVFDAFAAVGINTDTSYAWADLSASTTSGTGPLTITFDGTGSTAINSTITDYTWDFGDGSTATGDTVNYTYSNPGTYTVTLTVTDSSGYTNSASTTITVYASSDITSDTVWSTEHSPYVIYGGVMVSSSVTFTIDPGVVVKFYDSSSYLTINGTLDAQGTSTDGIIFTSYKDDDSGGDTNGDVDTTTPAAGDWRQIEFSSSCIATLDYVTVQYGSTSGYAAIEIQSDSVTVENSIITNSLYTGVFIVSSSPTFTHNTITNTTSTNLVIGEASATITDNTITGAEYGIYIYDYSANATTIAGNQVTDFGTAGIYFEGEGSLEISSNDISNGTDYGIYVYGGSAQISNNSISEVADFAMYIEESTSYAGEQTIDGNTLSSSTYGLYISDATAQVTNNTITDTTYPIAVSSLRESTYSGNTGSNNDYNSIFLSGSTNGDITLNADNDLVLTFQSFVVDTGDTLTIEPNTVVKFFDATSYLKVTGSLTAVGTMTEPIIFTSIKDDSNGGDTNNDSTTTSPSSGDWYYLQLTANSSATFEYVTIQYGGYTGTSYDRALLWVDDNAASISVNQSTIHNSQYVAVNIEQDSTVNFSNNIVTNTNGYTAVSVASDNATISNNTVSASSARAISVSQAAPVITGNTLSGSSYGLYLYGSLTTPNVTENGVTNSTYGIYTTHQANPSILTNNLFYNNTTYGLYNADSSVTITAENNWWGDASGPYHPTSNPTGLGDTVGSYVDFDPWLTSDPTADTTPPSDVTLGTVRKNVWAQTITLNWTNPTDSDFDHVQIDRTDVVAGTTTTLSSAETGVRYIDTTPSYGRTYTYILYTVDTSGNISTGVTTSNQRLRNPAPTNLTLTAGDTTITATWTASSAPATTLGGYIVYYGTSRTALTNSIDVGNTTSTTLTGLTNYTRYYVAVTAYNTTGTESPTSQIRATRPRP